VVATSNLGTSELIETGRNGKLVPQGNIQAMVDAVNEILEDTEQAEALCRVAEKQIDEVFTMETMLLSLEKIYLQKATVLK
jgi:glycosyltransferase involved in cell wall biosynthesis